MIWSWSSNLGHQLSTLISVRNFLITPLMVGAKGSKIIISTREKSGGSSLVQNLHPNLLQTLHPIPRINSKKRWLLFSEYAFSEANRSARLPFE